MNAGVECANQAFREWRDVCIPVVLNDSVDERSPKTSEHPTAYAILLSEIEPWPIPIALKKRLQDEKLQFGHEYVVSTEAIRIPISVKNFNEIMYFQSRIRDPNCFAVIELVMSTFDSVSDEVSSRYSCGWTMINPFVFAGDKEEHKYDEGSYKLITSGNLCIYRGSPRELITKKGDGKAILKQFNTAKMEVFMPYKLWSFGALNRIVLSSNIIQENQIVSPATELGTLSNTAINFLDSRGRTEGAIIGATSSGNEGSWTLQPPDTISFGDKYPLTISNITLEVPQRVEFERAMCSYAERTKKKTKNIFTWNKMGTTQRTASSVSNRRLKIGLHNGYNLLRNHWRTVNLVVSEEDNILKSLDDVVVSDFVKHINCAIVLIFEYTVSDEHSPRSPKKSVADNIVTIVIGAGVLCPFDGEKFCLKLNASNDHNVILPIKSNSTCLSFANGTIFSQNREPPRLRCCMGIPDTKIVISGNCAENKNEPPSSLKEEKLSVDPHFVANDSSAIVPRESEGKKELPSVTPLLPEVKDVASGGASTLNLLTCDDRILDSSLVKQTVTLQAQLPSDSPPQEHRELERVQASQEFNQNLAKSETAPERVYALDLLDTSDELRLLVDKIRGEEMMKSHIPRSRYRDPESTLRQQQRDAVRRHQRQRIGKGNTEILEQLFDEFTPNDGSLDSESRALKAVQWYREGNKRSLIFKHIQELKQGDN